MLVNGDEASSNPRECAGSPQEGKVESRHIDGKQRYGTFGDLHVFCCYVSIRNKKRGPR